MFFNIPIKTRELQNITTEEVRIEIRKIKEKFYGDVLTKAKLNNLNNELDFKINQKYGLKIKAEFTNNTLSLYGYTPDSKAVLDPNCGIKHISKRR